MTPKTPSLVKQVSWTPATGKNVMRGGGGEGGERGISAEDNLALLRSHCL